MASKPDPWIKTATGGWFNESTGELQDTAPEGRAEQPELDGDEVQAAHDARNEAQAEQMRPEPKPEVVDAPPENVTPLGIELAPAIPSERGAPKFSGALKLANGNELDLAVIAQLGLTFSASKFWNDAQGQSQAMAKLIVGLSLGLSPVAAMSDIHIIEGKPSLGAHALAALVQQSGRYRYRVTESTATRCVLAWFERVDGAWEAVGESSFTAEDAATAGLTGRPNFKKFPADMLYARAMSRGAKRYAPSALGGSVYVHGEIE